MGLPHCIDIGFWPEEKEEYRNKVSRGSTNMQWTDNAYLVGILGQSSNARTPCYTGFGEVTGGWRLVHLLFGAAGQNSSTPQC